MHKIFTILFGVLASLFALNRFYDLLDNSHFLLSVLIIALSFHVLIIMLIGLKLFNKFKSIGFWILLIFPIFVLIRHSYEYWTLINSKPIIIIPDNILSQMTMPYLDLIFFLELATGILALVLLFIENRKIKWLTSAKNKRAGSA
ncbi:hypothetical protein MATR_32540 [Marivirga tractuosa]|uniref:Uncharacterized protein n=1 Tax=Marivirga tractuosa (strain ATCC 23168 / DSM 4126 / NBRC 15989 / NCIMB 1408 / VKM B-1430 / H-43) TaxID=643867 RepID=E4TSV6_MARTH|nr:hypothetical protein Ftrac_2921 [Marivirga tractuosa DSM 4126]BDD16429.1 hypothetical protein MATR_32540 [Marivirga tractuosa]